MLNRTEKKYLLNLLRSQLLHNLARVLGLHHFLPSSPQLAFIIARKVRLHRLLLWKYHSFIICVHHLIVHVILRRLISLFNTALDLHLTVLLNDLLLTLVKEALVIGWSPEEILHKVREWKLNDPLKQVVDELFSLDTVCAWAFSQTLYYCLNFLLRSAIWNCWVKSFVQFLPTWEVIVKSRDVWQWLDLLLFAKVLILSS